MQGEYLGLILAGGQSRRMGQDKALLSFGDATLFEYVLRRFANQLDTIIISTTSQHPTFTHCGRVLVRDPAPFERLGPLSGLLTGFDYCQQLPSPPPLYKAIITIAVDTPFFPDDYVARLSKAAAAAPSTALISATAERLHPTFALWPLGAAPTLRQHLAGGNFSLLSFTERVRAKKVLFPDEENFFNINKQQQWVLAQHKLAMLRKLHGKRTD